MAPYSESPGPASRVTLERYFLAADFISGVGYGAQGVLYLICIHYLWSQRKARRINKFMLAYITLLFLLSTVLRVTLAHRTQLVFIENRNFPGGPLEYYEASLGGALNIVSQAAGVAQLFLSELFMVWRCWVVWYSVSRRAAYAVTFLPAFMLVVSPSGVALYFFATVHLNSPVAVHITAWILIHYTLVLSANAITTGLILARLIAHRRAVRMTLATPHAKEYASLISMLVESAVFYSIIGVGYLIVTGMGSPIRELLIDATISTQQISGYLIIARLAHGREWQTSTMSVARS
ncbi:hypothetical protein BD779DRAFT_291861 [Infundibulicybe gibba]|nr:hypothetical protein BD779DRAFT_291861 [Infundibulicybe gibba]